MRKKNVEPGEKWVPSKIPVEIQDLMPEGHVFFFAVVVDARTKELGLLTDGHFRLPQEYIKPLFDLAQHVEATE